MEDTALFLMFGRTAAAAGCSIVIMACINPTRASGVAHWESYTPKTATDACLDSFLATVLVAGICVVPIEVAKLASGFYGKNPIQDSSILPRACTVNASTLTVQARDRIKLSFGSRSIVMWLADVLDPYEQLTDDVYILLFTLLLHR